MKYTKEQAKRLKDKGMDGFTKYKRPLPDLIIKDGYFIIESKMNPKKIEQIESEEQLELISNCINYNE